MPSRRKHLRLHRRVVDPNRAAAGLRAVDHQVVGLGAALARIGRQQFEVLLSRGGERMVHGGPGVFLGVPGEHRKLDDPGEVPGLRVVQLELLAQPFAQRVQRLAADFECIGHKQQQVARRGLHPLGNLGQQFGAEVLGDRRGQLAPFFDLEPGQPLGAEIVRHEVRSARRCPCANSWPRPPWR